MACRAAQNREAHAGGGTSCTRSCSSDGHHIHQTGDIAVRCLPKPQMKWQSHRQAAPEAAVRFTVPKDEVSWRLFNEPPNMSWNDYIANDLRIPVESVPYCRKRLLRSICDAFERPSKTVPSKQPRLTFVPKQLPVVRRRRHKGGRCGKSRHLSSAAGASAASIPSATSTEACAPPKCGARRRRR